MSQDQRLVKLHKQPDSEIVKTGENASTVSGSSIKTVTVNTVSRGIPSAPMRLTSSLGSSTDEPKSNVTVPPPNIRCKTLIRGHALEGNSPPPESFVCQIPPKGELQNGCLLATGGSTDNNGKGQVHEGKHSLLASHEISHDSGHGTLECPDDASDNSAVSPESRLDSASAPDVYTDLTRTNIPKFMKETLQKSPRDRTTILSLEDQILSFVNSQSSQIFKMGELSAYDRMIVHRLAAFLGLKHNVDSTGKCIVLSKTEKTRSVKLSELVQSEEAQYESKRKILKKPASFDEKHSRGSNRGQFGSNRAKSLEERTQTYYKARERIFKNGEIQYEGSQVLSNELAVDTFHHHQLQDSIKCNGQLSTSWVRTESSESQNDASNTNYNTAPNYQTGSQVLVPVATSSDDRQVPSSEVIAFPVTQFQHHFNPDGVLYNFDPTCPPPFMVQTTQAPPVTSTANHILYQNDTISEMTAGFAGASLGSSLDEGCESFAVGGVQNQPVAFVLHPQSVYTSGYPSQLTQGQYYLAPQHTVPQQPVRYIAYPFPQGQHLLPGAAVDAQGQATVPMPAVGIPTVQGGYQMIGSPYQTPIAVCNPQQYMDLTYHYGSAPEAMVVGGAGGLNTSATVGVPGAPHLVLAYTQSQTLVQQHALLSNHQAQFTPNGSTTQGTYYTLPVSSPTPPLSLTQPPPSSHHHQQQQPTVFFTSNIGNQVTYPIPVSNSSSSSSTSSLKQVPASYLHTQYTSQPPQQQLHSHQPQSLMVSPSNNLPAQLTLNYSQPVPFNPGQPVGQIPTAQRPQLVALQASPYQVRPVGATMLQLAGGPVVQPPQLGTRPHFQTYHWLRPAGSDVRLMNPGSIRSRLSPLPITSISSPQTRPKSSNPYRQFKKGGKKYSHDVDDSHPGNQATTPQQQTGYMSIMAPVNVPGSNPYVHSHLPSSSSNRQ